MYEDQCFKSFLFTGYPTCKPNPYPFIKPTFFSLQKYHNPISQSSPRINLKRKLIYFYANI